MRGYGPLLEPPEVVSRAATVAKILISRTRAILYVYETLLEWLAQDLQDMAAKLRQLIQKEDTVVCQPHIPRHRDLPPADQPHI
jgi:hypothetical protein